MVSNNPNPQEGFYLDPNGMALPGLGPFAAVTATAAAAASTTSSSEDLSKKIRKPYTITKSRESWTEPEHDKFLEALQLMADHDHARDDTEVIEPIAPHIQELPSTSLSKATDYLQDGYRIYLQKDHQEKYRRYALLQATNIFNTLVTLYSTLFHEQWQHFRRYLEQFDVPAGLTQWTFAARVYVSCWIHDLYPPIREAVKKLTPLAFKQHFSMGEPLYSLFYDEYLVRLNASIRPTYLKGMMEDTLYIPIFSEQPVNWRADNPLGIVGWNTNYTCLHGLIAIMQERKFWNMTPLITDTLGRPFWLFDWHANNTCCAWFPA
ncbi:uncharacterized protein LOC21397379 isoform X2 [Morus notabilis]|uniref:uncharacterized protein LOC21397379 isoform X2 n=1 Tax=Morus notabilis TaxID=981085 RepID=UPI000CECF44C|nr:uncharacterized protein LOC21397379 isoform X2 [Morus notabilis]